MTGTGTRTALALGLTLTLTLALALVSLYITGTAATQRIELRLLEPLYLCLVTSIIKVQPFYQLTWLN